MPRNPYLNALVLIEQMGRDLAAEIEASEMEAGAQEAATFAIAAMVRATESHRALLEMHEQARLN